MIYSSFYKDRPAYVVETDSLIATLLPEDGAKLTSLRRKTDGKELLATKPGDTYRVLTYDGSYVDSECSAFDDMFPTVDPDTPTGTNYGVYPDHGECCRLPHAVRIENDALILTARSRMFPVTYEKTVQAGKNGELVISYKIENHSEVAFPFLWAGHIMLAGEDGAEVLTPFTNETPTEIMFADCASMPLEELPRDRLMKHEPGVGTTYKFYYLEPMPEGLFGVKYVDGTKLLFTFDPEKLPYLGLWLNNGAFQNGYSITPEPCTVPFDAPERAAKRGYTSTIPAGGAFAFAMQINLTGGIA